jgi:hypothetical protein
METISQSFAVGGIWMWVILILGIISYLTSIVALAFLAVSTRKRLRLTLIWLGAVLLAFGISIFVIGAVAYGVGMSQVEHALAFVEASLVDTAREQGTREAMLPLNFSLIIGGFPTLVGIVSLIRGVKTPRKQLAVSSEL